MKNVKLGCAIAQPIEHVFLIAVNKNINNKWKNQSISKENYQMSFKICENIVIITLAIISKQKLYKFACVSHNIIATDCIIMI